MASLQRLAGVSSVSINGNVFNNTAVEYSPFQSSKELLIALNGIAGYREMYVGTVIRLTLYDYGQLTVQDFPTAPSSVQINLANGKQILGNSMIVIGVVNVDGAEGTFQIEFQGTGLQEQIAAVVS